jgi:hypothetical protein
MYEVITLHNPFKGKKRVEIKSQIKSGKYPRIEYEEGLYKLYDIEMINIINEMLSVYFLFCSFFFISTYFYFFFLAS